MLYGRLPTTRMPAGERAKSNSSASACVHASLRGNCAASGRGEIAVDLDDVEALRASSSGRVSAPWPGPISTMHSRRLRAIGVDDALEHAAVVQEMLAEPLARAMRAASRQGLSRLDQAARVGAAGAGEIERRAVVDRGAHDRQARASR